MHVCVRVWLKCCCMILFLIICTVKVLIVSCRTKRIVVVVEQTKKRKKAVLTLPATFSAVRSLNRQSVTGTHKNVLRTTTQALRFLHSRNNEAQTKSMSLSDTSELNKQTKRLKISHYQTNLRLRLLHTTYRLKFLLVSSTQSC